MRSFYSINSPAISAAPAAAAATMISGSPKKAVIRAATVPTVAVITFPVEKKIAGNVIALRTVYGMYLRKLRRNFDFIFERKRVRGSILIR